MSGIKILESDEMMKWDSFIDSNKFGTIYHTSLWRKLIKDVYGHQPLYLTIVDNNGNIQCGMPLFIIKSKIFTKKLSSLPCAQYCNPLVSEQEKYDQLMKFNLEFLKNQKFKFLELKTSESFELNTNRFGNSFDGYCTYVLDIDRTLDVIKSSFHKNCIQRPINKSYKSGLKLKIGNSINDVKSFYELYLKMRKEYGLLPQPYKYFLSMWEIMCKGKNIDILLARHNGQIISSILLLKYKDTVIYEYGASNSRMLHLCPSHFLLWEAIKRSKLLGYKRFDFGRTSYENPGLAKFKERWGTQRIVLPYYYIPRMTSLSKIRQKSLAKMIMYYSMKHLHKSLCQTMGRLLYKNLV